MHAFKCDKCDKFFCGNRHHEVSIVIDKYGANIVRVSDLCDLCISNFVKSAGIVLTHNEEERIEVDNANRNT